MRPEITEEIKEKYGHKVGGKTIFMNSKAAINVNLMKIDKMIDEERRHNGDRNHWQN